MLSFNNWLLKKEGGAIIVGDFPKKKLAKAGFNVAGAAGLDAVSMPGYPIGTKEDKAEHRKKKIKRNIEKKKRKPLHERVYENLPDQWEYDTFPVYIDPTIDELKRAFKGDKEVRGFIDGDHIFVWSAKDGYHDEISDKLDMPFDVAFSVYINSKGKYEVGPSSATAGLARRKEREVLLKKHPKILRMLGISSLK